MTTTKRRVGSRPELTDEANALITAIRADSRHNRERTEGASTSTSTKSQSLRLEPISGNTYGLSFHRQESRTHPGRAERRGQERCEVNDIAGEGRGFPAPQCYRQRADPTTPKKLIATTKQVRR